MYVKQLIIYRVYNVKYIYIYKIVIYNITNYSIVKFYLETFDCSYIYIINYNMIYIYYYKTRIVQTDYESITGIKSNVSTQLYLYMYNERIAGESCLMCSPRNRSSISTRLQKVHIEYR